MGRNDKLSLDAKWKETAGNRTDTNIKNVLMTTYSEMYLQVPTLAIMKVMDDIPDRVDSFLIVAETPEHPVRVPD